MSLVSMEFLLFLLAAAAGYYWIPKKYQWVWLLVFSYIYYMAGGWKTACFILFTTFTTYAGARLLEQAARQKDKQKKSLKREKRMILLAVLLLNFGMLGVLKYANFAIHTVNGLLHTSYGEFSLLLPLGISFYTFQSMGYLLDVYWGRCKAEKNVFRFALFVSFFPQILQGPISRFGTLAQQLYDEHRFNLREAEQGFQRILWGFFKKMVIADHAVIFVDAIFGNPQIYSGLSIIGVLAYSVQLYCDFSGGMDVVIGIARIFGIRLDENFRQPFFAVSITDFWHRWHITLGTWMKDYVFYPISLSKWMNRLGKWCKKIFGKQTGRTLPICLANIIVFLVVGVWHGAAWKYIAYGLFNGGIIAFSGLMAPAYRKWKAALHINDKSKGFRLFQVVRTFILVNISWFFDRGADVGTALLMMKNALMHFQPKQLLAADAAGAFLGGNGNMTVNLAVILAGCLVVFAVSLRQEMGKDTGAAIAGRAPAVRMAVYASAIFLLPILGRPSAAAGGFIYAQF